MIANARSSRRDRAGSSDTETLQTDVMRFMAIIGLCLTAVFALVRSLPVAQEEIPSRIPDSVGEARSQELQQQLAEVARELTRLRQERDSAARALEQARSQVRELAPVTRQLAGLHQERDQTQRALEQARERMQELAARNQQAWEDQRSAARELAGLEERLAYQRRQLAAVRAVAERERLAQEQPEPAPPAPLERAPPAPEPIPVAEPIPVREPRPIPEPISIPERLAPTEVAAAKPVPAPVGGQSGERGFVLRFASSAALDRLVRSGTVGFVGIQGQQAWKLSLAGGRPTFTSAPKPTRFHEMAPTTVPAAYLRAFARVADLAAPAGVVWGVRLPPPIEDRVGRLIRTSRGGVLVIQADGQVVLEGNHES